MDFDFSDDLKQLRDEARRSLERLGARAAARTALEAAQGQAGREDAQALWRKLVELGWTGAGVPPHWGGSGMGTLALCLLAEELGRALAPVPFTASVVLATEALLLAGSDEQKSRWLPQLADGSMTGTLAISEGHGAIAPQGIASTVGGGRLTGLKLPVMDGLQACLAIVVAPDEAGRWLHLVDLRESGGGQGLAGAEGVTREALATLDDSRPQARLHFHGAAAEPLQGQGWVAVERVLQRAAVVMAFEQLGVAQAALEMARDYALERYAFGRPIGTFQAIKHKLADVYVAIELARSNAYRGAWALNRDAPELPAAAAAARIAATEAAWLATKENLQTHGGMGYTWDLDCHLYYRRARMLALALGGAHEWKRHLMDAISPKAGPQQRPPPDRQAA